MHQDNFTVSGMHCEACKKLIGKRLLAIPGVKTTDIDVTNGNVQVISQAGVNPVQIEEALKGTDYHVRNR